jgi:hypothetical protein
MASRSVPAVPEVPQALIEKALASGTPHFFVNGRRLVGAQPTENSTHKAEIDAGQGRRRERHASVLHQSNRSSMIRISRTPRRISV